MGCSYYRPSRRILADCSTFRRSGKYGIYHTFWFISFQEASTSNAPATFQRLIDRLKDSLPDVFIMAYLDDIIIRSSTLAKHREDLERVFGKFKSFNLRANREKTQFCCPEVKFLGHIINKNGITTDPKKIKAICNRKEPKNVKGHQSFLQTCSWCRRFIPKFA